MKLQASRPISLKNLQSQTSAQTKNRLAISRLGILHGRQLMLPWISFAEHATTIFPHFARPKRGLW